MDVTVWDILKSKLSAACTEVSIAVPVALQVTIYGAHQSETADVELSVLIEKRLLYVFLYDVRPSVAIDVNILNEALYMIEFSADLYPTSSVGILSWLDDPQILAKLGQPIQDGFFRRVLGIVE